MQVLERIGRMLRADAHGMMDRVEERSLLLKQHFREAEAELSRKRVELEAVDEERERVAEDGRRLEARVAALDADVELALQSGDPELARYAVRQLLPRREALRGLLERAKELDERRRRLVERLDEQEARLAELRPRLRAALERPAAPVGELLGAPLPTDEQVELELLRRRGGGPVREGA